MTPTILRQLWSVVEMTQSNILRTYALTGITKYGVLVSGIQTGFFNDFLAIAIYPMLITKSLKRPYFVTAYNGDFVQCVSPNPIEA